MDLVLQRFLPDAAVEDTLRLVAAYNANIKIVSKRVSKHGDYRRLPNGTHQITVNATPNKYQFLITLIHEIAHLVAFETYGRRIKPHGKEWKHTFQKLMLPLLRPEVFPSKLLSLLAAHLKNPKASSNTDLNLAMALKDFDEPSSKNHVFEVPYGGIFKWNNGKQFRRGKKRVKRYECVEISSGRKYLFQPNAEVELV